MKKKRMWLVLARVAAGLSQKQLAAAVGVSPATMSGYESGQYLPSPPIAKRIGEHLGVDYLQFYAVE